MVDYLSQFYPSTALKQYDLLIEKIQLLRQTPLMCEEYRVASSDFVYRRMVVGNYLVFYVVYEDVAEIHNVINGKMDYDRYLT